MLEVLVKYAWSDRENIKKEKGRIKEILSAHAEQETITKFLEEMKKRLKQMEEDIKRRKQRKLHRDSGDYESGRILTHSRKYDHLYDTVRPGDQETTPTWEHQDEEAASLSDTYTDLSEITRTPESSTSEGDGVTRPKTTFLDEYRLLKRSR